MRFSRFGAASLAAAALLVAAPAAADEVKKTLRAELSAAEVSNFSVENLAGTMRITPGSDGAVSVVVTVHAETQALADGVRLERVSAPGEPPVWRVRYPDHVGTIRYRAPLDEDTYQISLGLSFSSSSYRYDGRTYRISPGHGRRLWADVLVRVPPLLTRARFQNLAGLVDAEGLRGGLRLEVASADLHLRDMEGELSCTAPRATSAPRTFEAAGARISRAATASSTISRERRSRSRRAPETFTPEMCEPDTSRSRRAPETSRSRTRTSRSSTAGRAPETWCSKSTATA